MRFLKSCGIAVLLLANIFVQAQDSMTEVTVIADTVAIYEDGEPAYAEKDSVFVFDSIAAESLTPLYERPVADSVLQRLRNDDAFWYINMDFKKKKAADLQNDTSLSRLFRQQWFRNLLWAIIVGSFVVVLLLFLAKSNIRLFQRAPAALHTAGNDLPVQDIFSTDYDTEISKAVQQGDFRAAIRLQYLQTLSLLADKNAIQYKEDFTNSDYLQQLRPTAYYPGFKTITRHFEYSWYGKFPVTPAVYKTIETDYRTFKNSMGI